MPDKDIEFDEELLANLPADAQLRLIRVAEDLITATVARRYGLNPAELRDALPDMEQGNTSPGEFERLAELAAIERSNPLAGVTDPGQLLKIWQEGKKGGENGDKED